MFLGAFSGSAFGAPAANTGAGQGQGSTGGGGVQSTFGAPSVFGQPAVPASAPHTTVAQFGINNTANHYNNHTGQGNRGRGGRGGESSWRGRGRGENMESGGEWTGGGRGRGRGEAGANRGRGGATFGGHDASGASVVSATNWVSPNYRGKNPTARGISAPRGAMAPRGSSDATRGSGRGGRGGSGATTWVNPNLAAGGAAVVDQHGEAGYNPNYRGRGRGGNLTLRGGGRGASRGAGTHNAINGHGGFQSSFHTSVDMQTDQAPSAFGGSAFSGNSNQNETSFENVEMETEPQAIQTWGNGASSTFNAFGSTGVNTGSVFGSGQIEQVFGGASGNTRSVFGSGTSASTFTPTFSSGGSAFEPSSITQPKPKLHAFGSAAGLTSSSGAFSTHSISRPPSTTSAFQSSPSATRPLSSTFQSSPSAFSRSSASASSPASIPKPTPIPNSKQPTARNQPLTPQAPVTAASRQERFSAVPTGNRYEELKERRVQERVMAIKAGLIPDPNIPAKLEDAIPFVGTCRDMAPEFERHEREYQKNIERFEKIPGTESVNHSAAVKAFARSAAGSDQPLPSDVRPPDVLLSTLDYLLTEIVDENDMYDSHAFVRDRTRSIRQDFTLQNYRGMEAITAHEIIARYHIMCLYHLCEINGFSEQQEMEQLQKVLTSLQEFYTDMNRDGVVCENEAEFRAYHAICHLRDPDMLRQLQNLPIGLAKDPYIQNTAKAISFARRNNAVKQRARVQSEAAPNFFSRFFKLISGPQTTYLMACLLHTYFWDIQKGGLKALNKAYNERYSGVPAEDLVSMLGFDDIEECIANCQVYDIMVTEDETPLVLFGRRDPATRRHIFSDGKIRKTAVRRNVRVVEPKRLGCTFAQVVYGELGGPSFSASAAAPPANSTFSISRSTSTLANRPNTLKPIPNSQPWPVAAPPTAAATARAFAPLPQGGLATLGGASKITGDAQSTFGQKTSGSAVSTGLLSSRSGISMSPDSSQSIASFVSSPLTAKSVFGATTPRQPSTPQPALNTLASAINTSATVPVQAAPNGRPPAFMFHVPKTTSPVTLATSAVAPAFSFIPPAASFPSATSQPSEAAANVGSSSLQNPTSFLFSGGALSSSTSQAAPLTHFIPASTLPQEGLFTARGSSEARLTNGALNFSSGSNATDSNFSVSPIHTLPISPPVPIVTRRRTDQVISKTGRMYSVEVIKGVVDQILDEVIQKELHDSATLEIQQAMMANRMARYQARMRAVKELSEELARDALNYVVGQVVQEVAANELRENHIAQAMIARWRKFAAKQRMRREEMVRRKSSFVANIKAMESSAELGTFVSGRRKGVVTQSGRMGALQAEHQRQQQRMRERGGVDETAAIVKAFKSVQVGKRKRGSSMSNASPDEQKAHFLEEFLGPRREVWTPLPVLKIVQSTLPDQILQRSSASLALRAKDKFRWRLFVGTPSFLQLSSKWLLAVLGCDMGLLAKNPRSGSMVAIQQGGGEDSAALETVVHGVEDKTVTDLLGLSKQTISETSAFFFEFSQIPFSDQQARDNEMLVQMYWTNEHNRLVKFLSCFPKVCQAIVFVLWPTNPLMWDTISPRAELYLQLATLVQLGHLKEYRFLVMPNIPHLGKFVAGSLEWLASMTRDHRLNLDEEENELEDYDDDMEADS